MMKMTAKRSKDLIGGSDAPGAPPGRYARPETMARREKLRRLLIDNPLAVSDVKRLAEFFGVDIVTIYRDLKALKDSLPERMDGELSLRVVSTLDRIEREAQMVYRRAKNDGAKVAALKLQIDALKEGLTLLERLGVVEPKGRSSEVAPVIRMEFDASAYEKMEANAEKAARKAEREAKAAKRAAKKEKGS